MDAQRWAKIESLYHAALAKKPGEREDYLAVECAHEPDVRNEVESLLKCADEPVAVGKRLGAYEIIGLLGAGGMGEVYRARDTKLRREVAIKVLPREFQNDPARLVRFEREALVLASLNHSHIAAIYGLEEFQGLRFLVLELVEGPTLAERIASGPIPADEAVGTAVQIMGAMEYAHERNVIHRDLKPANIKITADGRVKVLDFGLAKALAGPDATTDPANSPTVTIGGTAAGVILGTAAYMSPEQARGKPLDKRTDIWSFGVVLYEMLTGRQPFQCDTVSETLASVLKEQPDLNQVPAHLQPLLRSCLQKDPKQRLHDIADGRLLLEAAPAPPKTAQTPRLAWTVAVCAIVAVLSLGWLYLRKPAEQPRVFKLSIPAPEGTFTPAAPEISPDGRHVAFGVVTAGRQRLWVRDLDSFTSRSLPGTEGGYRPFWSPDSRTIAFFANGELKRTDPAGGPALTICDSPTGFFGAWSKGNTILFTPRPGGLFSVPAAGGTPVPVTSFEPASVLFHAVRAFLPDGHHFLYTAVTGPGNEGIVYAGDLNSNSRSRVLEGKLAAYASGYLLFMRGQTLMAQPFDEGRLHTTGNPEPVADSVKVESRGPPLVSASENGVLVYLPVDTGVLMSQLTWFDRSGKSLGVAGASGEILFPAISPDGASIALDRQDLQNSGIWLKDPAHGSDMRLTPGHIKVSNPVWSPDGRRIAFSTLNQSGMVYQVYQHVLGEAGEDQPLDVDTRSKVLEDWSRDGRYLIETALDSNKAGHIWVLPLFGDRKAYPLLHSEANELETKLSPDTHWLAYASDETSRKEVYVVGFPKLDGKWQISTGGGDRPVWSRDGKELYFISADQKMMSVGIKSGDRFDYTAPKPLFDTPISPFASFDIAKDGRFLIPVPMEQGGASEIDVIVNWTAALKR